MATHSSTLAWEIPWTEEPRRLYSPRGRQESDTTERLHFSLHFIHRESRSLLGGHRALPVCPAAVVRGRGLGRQPAPRPPGAPDPFPASAGPRSVPDCGGSGRRRPEMPRGLDVLAAGPGVLRAGTRLPHSFQFLPPSLLLPWVAETVGASARNAGSPGSIPGWEDSPGEREWQPSPVLSPGKSQDRKSVV